MRTTLLMVFVMLLGACASRQAPDFRGRWQPLNQYADAPVAIPLRQAQVYSASPLDRTLKTLLTRWAQASKRSLSYEHSADYTLYDAVRTIDTTDIDQATAQLAAAYAGYGVSISVEPGRITVRDSRAAQTATEAGASQ